MDNLGECPFCSGRIAPHWRAAKVWKCSECGLLFRNPLPSQADLSELYEESWTDPLRNKRDTGGTDVSLARTYAAQLAASLGRKDLSGLNILDFGAGRGAMLSELSELGARVYAVDPYGYQHLRNAGFPASRTLDEMPEGMAFDGVVAIDVVEHLPEPWNVMRRFADLLVPCGWLFVATMNSSGLNAVISRSKWLQASYPGHLVFFTPHSMVAVLHDCGFTKVRRLRWPIQYNHGPLRRTIQRMLQLASLDGELRYLAITERCATK